MRRKAPLSLLLLLTILASMLPSTLAQGPTPAAPPQTDTKTGPAEESPTYIPVSEAGPLVVSHVYTNSTPVAIPDNGCAAGWTTSLITITDSFLIGDLNVGLWIAHTYRTDLDMYLVGPDATVVELYTDPDTSADNLNVLLDDSSPNLADAVNHNPPPPYYYAWWRPEGSLAAFNGKNAQGVWTLRVCDDAAPDAGTLNTWTLFFQTGLVLAPKAQTGVGCWDTDVVYSFTVLNYTAVDQAFDLTYSSIWPASGPSTTPVIPAGGTWNFNVTVHIPPDVTVPDSDVLTVTASGGGETAQATATTNTDLLYYRDYANAPRPVRDHSVVYWNGKIYKIGGYDGAARNYLDIYDIATNAWSTGADVPANRYFWDCVAIDYLGPKIYCAGGYDTAARNTLYIYDIALNSWTTGASMPANRYTYAGVALGGLYYVIGGFSTTYEATIWAYNPATDTWNTALAPMTTARRYHMAGAIGGKIVVAGGYGTGGVYLSSVEIYDPATNAWTAGAPIPSTWLRAADAVKHDRYLLLLGGDDNSTATSSNVVWGYDAVQNGWTQWPTMPHSLYGAEADGDGTDVWTVSGRLYEGGLFSYSPYTTKLVQCPCQPAFGADFTVDPPQPWVGYPATFTGSAGGFLPLTWEWDFGDLVTGTGQIVTHTYAATGTYTVIMTATNCDGSGESVAVHTVQVVTPPNIAVQPHSLSSRQCVDEVTTHPLEICNQGDAPLNWWLGEYSPTLGFAPGAAWETMAPLPAGRVFEAVVAAGPYVFVLGGTSDAGGAAPVNTNYRYDTRTDTWQTMAPMPAALAFIDGATIDGKVYIPGGVAPVQDNNTYVYDPVSDSWSTIPANGGYVAPEQYQAVAMGDSLYVLGGIIGGASVPNVWVLDTTSGTWTPGVPMLRPRMNCAAAAIGGRIYALGGVTYPGFVPDMTSEVFDGTAWSYIAPVPTGGGAYTRWSYLADGADPSHVWLAAGRRDTAWAVLNHAGTYNLASDTWTTSPDYPLLAQGRVYLEGDVAADGYMYAMGGRDAAGAVIYDTNERLFTGYLDVPWLSENPTAGTVPGHDCETVLVTFDSTGMAPGDYYAGLLIESNDPVTPFFTVPVTLTIEPLPDLQVTAPPLEAELCPTETTTMDLSLCNIGGCTLDWEIHEVTRTLAGSMPFVPVEVAGQGINPGLTTASPAPERLAQPTAPTHPETVLWDQPLSTVDQNAYVDQEFPDFPDFSSFLADDFVNDDPWDISTIFVPGDLWNGATDLNLVTSLTWQIYADDGTGYPDGDPSGGGNPPVWTLTLPPSDPQVVITPGSSGYPSNTTLNLDTPLNLPPGHWWLVFYPTMEFSLWGQYGRQPSDTTNGYVGKFINPGGGFGYGTQWQDWYIIGPTQQDIAFRLEGEVAIVYPDVPWLSEDPIQGSLGLGECVTVSVTFDSTGMAPGEYHAGLLIESNDPDTPSITLPVTLTVDVPPAAAFSSNSPVCLNETAVFTNSSSGTPPLTYLWIFGDGITSTLENPTHTYGVGGTYSVTLVATNTCGVDEVTQPFVVNSEPIADFTYDPTSGNAPLTVYFTDTSQYAISPTWDFGDGTPGGAGAVVSHTYTVAGDYSATLTVQSPYGCGEGTISKPVHVALPSAPVAGFESSSPDCLGETTVFTNTTEGVDVTYLWDFGDGITSTLESPTHTYALAGTYLVVLTATNAGGSDTIRHDVEIRPQPTANFTYTADFLEVTFTNLSTDATAYLWDFGDGIGTSTETNPIYTYAAAGTYTVTLTASNDCGEAIFTLPLTVEECVAVEIITVTPDISGCVVTFSAEVIGTEPIDWLWDLGPFGTFTETNPVVDFLATGTYTGTLEVWNCVEGYDLMPFSVDVSCASYIYLPLIVKSAPLP